MVFSAWILQKIQKTASKYKILLTVVLEKTACCFRGKKTAAYSPAVNSLEKPYAASFYKDIVLWIAADLKETDRQRWLTCSDEYDFWFYSRPHNFIYDWIEDDVDLFLS